MAERIRLSRARGWRLPEGAVVVSRPSRWGNPFIVGQNGTREQCAGKFMAMASGFISFSDKVDPEIQLKMNSRLRRQIGELAGKDLACWCPLDGKPCHADVLLALANPDQPAADWLRRPVDTGRIRLGMSATNLEKLTRARARKQREGASDGPTQES